MRTYYLPSEMSSFKWGGVVAGGGLCIAHGELIFFFSAGSHFSSRPKIKDDEMLEIS